MTFSEIRTRKQLTVKLSTETAKKRNSQFNKTETTERKAETGKLGNGGGNPERLMKDAHAHKNEKEETGLIESPTKNEKT
ncbi:MAG: hypothetical protein QXJ94_02950 [Candidatus Bathyarchaeia archaeon]